MPRTKTQPKVSKSPEVPTEQEVLTLAEAAAYLRVPERDLLPMISTQGLPARKIGEEWRLLKSAVQDWLRAPQPAAAKPDFWATQLGAFKDDPSLEEMLQEIYDRRGRPMTEEG
jgi:excisionase family DNA binding protein